MTSLTQINRINAWGLRYSIMRQDNQVLVTHGEKSMMMDITIEEFNQCWYNWYVAGKKVQDAFPKLTSAQREFLMTGITETEWNDIFSDDESEDKESNESD